MVEDDQRPVYVVGAGLSRAINSRMPLTDELGVAVRATVGDRLPPLEEGATFEDWLTVLSTPLPFLQGHENTQRRALAEQVTAAIADELDIRTDDSSGGPLPPWLQQLVSLWHMEQAVVITFNYDLLIERAVSSSRLLVDLERDFSDPWVVRGPRVVWPAPRLAAAMTRGDLEPPTAASFQLLKLHGSLNWYWAQGDGATLIADPDSAVFGQTVNHDRADMSGARSLDRFLIPPVTSKDSYYNVNLVHTLWRSAYRALRNASSLTILGYSMPAADRIAAALLQSVAEGTPVDLVNRDLGDESDPRTPLGRAQELRFKIARTFDGDAAVANYVARRVSEAAESVRTAIVPEDSHLSVVVRVPTGREQGMYAVPYGDETTTMPFVITLDAGSISQSDMPPRELAVQQLPRGTASYAYVYSPDRVAALSRPMTFSLNQERFVAIGVERTHIGKRTVLLLHSAGIEQEVGVGT